MKAPRRSASREIAHALKTPLTTIRLYTELIKKQLEADKPVAPAQLDKMLSEINRLQTLIDTLL